MCTNAPNCVICNPNNPANCIQCNTGFYNMNGTCKPCASYCATCNTASFCLTLLNPTGFTLVMTSTTTNSIAACDPGCITCSTTNPTLCTSCTSGYYLYSPPTVSTISYCIPCTTSSYCATCSITTPATCLSCFSGSYLTASNVCMQCQFPCIACGNQVATNCTSCPIGYILLANFTCVTVSSIGANQNTTLIQNCANAFNVGSAYNCSLCLQGYVQTGFGCAPCAQGCLVCNANNLVACIQCGPSYYLNSSTSVNVCTPCQANCLMCTPVGCLSCMKGYTLNQMFQCQLNCVAPCASCSVTPFACTSCVLGYTLGTQGNCVRNASCNTGSNCQVCPFGYALLINSTKAVANQTC
jgi:hypothetical protein